LTLIFSNDDMALHATGRAAEATRAAAVSAPVCEAFNIARCQVPGRRGSDAGVGSGGSAVTAQALLEEALRRLRGLAERLRQPS
jgi:hypothetical protein